MIRLKIKLFWSNLPKIGKLIPLVCKKHDVFTNSKIFGKLFFVVLVVVVLHSHSLYLAQLCTTHGGHFQHFNLALVRGRVSIPIRTRKHQLLHTLSTTRTTAEEMSTATAALSCKWHYTPPDKYLFCAEMTIDEKKHLHLELSKKRPEKVNKTWLKSE